MDVFTYVFVIMISLIAVANVFNTISTNIRLRRRELAMLRSVGMSDRDFNKMMNFECVFYGMRTLLFGLPIAGIISWLIYEGLVAAERMDNFDFVFPWGSMGHQRVQRALYRVHYNAVCHQRDQKRKHHKRASG